MFYWLFAGVSFALSLVLVKLVQFLAYRWNILDYPKSERKIHKKPIPLLGGLGIFFTFWLIVFLLQFSGFWQLSSFTLQNLLGIFAASTVLMIGGLLDDKYDLKARYQLIFPFLAIFFVIISGLGIHEITNPLTGQLFDLDILKIPLFTVANVPYFFSILGDGLTIVWLLGMMYTTKLLDGVDGLVAGIGLIGALIMLFLTLSMNWFQADTAYLLVIFIGAVGGFLVYNLPKASIFLGEGGALFMGFFLGVISILAGSKIATALLVFALPIIDGLWVMFYRKLNGLPIGRADKNHLHHRLLKLGWTVPQILLFIYCITFLFGLSTLLLQPFIKFIVLTILVILVIIFEYIISKKLKSKSYEI